MQASILMAGVSDISHPHETSVVGFSDVEVREDGSFVPRMPVDELESDPQHTERKLMRRMGTTMTEAMIAAFACELAMKAISLTCNDEAKKTHDLLTLFQELPGRSRERIQADYPEIADVIRKGRHTFGGGDTSRQVSAKRRSAQSSTSTRLARSGRQPESFWTKQNS